jgi:autoinducer 2 (AI-2) kinase
MPHKEYLLSLDFGTGAGRCYLVSTDGKISFESYKEWEYEYPPEAQPGGSEFNPGAFWKILSCLIQETLHKSGISPSSIIAISSTSQREGVVFLNKSGEEIYAGPNLDMRYPDNKDDFEKRFAEKIHKNCGHWPFPMFLPYRLLWFKQNKPKIFDAISSVVLLNNWILYRLCGVTATEPSNGIETLFVNLNSRKWNNHLVEEMGIDSRILPPVYESGTQIGVVSTVAAEETGLAVGTPVILGGADSQCGLLGSGVIEDGGMGVVLGTYGPLQMVVPNPVFAKPELIWSGCHIIPDKWVIESTSMEAGQTYRWVRDVFYSEDTGDVYTKMSHDALESPIGANQIRAYLGPRLPNYHHLEFECPGGFTIKLPTTPGKNSRGDFSRAAIEAVSFGVKLNADRLQKAANRKMVSLHASGGLSKSPVMVEALSNVLETVVRVPEQKEGSAIGAAICAGVGVGIYSNMSEGVKALVRYGKIQSPEIEKIHQYQDVFYDWKERYVEMYGKNILVE